MQDVGGRARHLDWDGCFNARDLGGFRTADGRVTRGGALVRADDVARLTNAGWSALQRHGVRTIVDLRNDDEIRADAAPRPEGVSTVHVPMDDDADTEFWQYCWSNDLDGSPLYYQPFLDRKPERCAAVVAAIANAGPGGVAFHCVGGRDRTGLITLLLLAVVGVAPEDIASDYELSADRLDSLYAALGIENQNPIIAEILARKNTSARALLLAILETLDVDAYLRSGGLNEDGLAAVRARLVGPTSE
jgi:protein-tyrosine phosphatase